MPKIFKGILTMKGLSKSLRYFTEKNLKELFDSLNDKIPIYYGAMKVDGFSHIKQKESIGKIIDKKLDHDKIVIRFMVNQNLETKFADKVRSLGLSVGAKAENITQDKMGISYLENLHVDHVTIAPRETLANPYCIIQLEKEAD